MFVPYLQNPPVQETLNRTSDVDDTVLAAFARSSPPVTVVAVGGYGRRELFPYSDVDLLLLSAGPLEAEQRDRLGEFLRSLWDSGLRVSQSVHTPAECCTLHDGNLELTISLLDQRYLCGDRDRYEQLNEGFPKLLRAERDTITARLIEATNARHVKYGNTIYHLEPNVKEHPGGLRDLQTTHWLARLKTLESKCLNEARDFLFSVRIELHRYFKRDSNLLSFEAQEAIAADPANWMRQYYRNARQISGAVSRVLDACQPGSGLVTQFRDWRSRLSTAEFTVSRERVLLRNPGQLQADPAAAGRLLQFVARHGLKLAPDTERRLTELPEFTMNWPEFRQLLALPHCVTALRAMAGLGLLAKLMPEWTRIDCLVVRDFYHRYTVDEHTLETIHNLEDLAESKDASRKRFAGLYAEIDHPEILHFGLLLHDLGKGEMAGEHATKSAALAESILERFQVRSEDRDAIVFLIEHHLDLSSIMTSRDLSDSFTARQVAERTGTIERLKLLTLMTYADISAVNPTAMTPWRLDQLWRVYRIGQDEFTRELASDRIEAPAEPETELAAFIEGFPTRYLRTHSNAEIQRHKDLARHVPGIELSRLNGSYQITVVTPDRPSLLASISGALASFGFNILKAEAFANRHGLVLDSFVFDDPHRTLELNPTETERVRDTIERTILGKVDAGDLMGKRHRAVPVKRIEPSISFANDVSETATLIEVVGEDRPGLLHDISFAISSTGADIEVVLVDTEAHKALDVFYVTAAGCKLSDEHQERLKVKLINVCKG